MNDPHKFLLNLSQSLHLQILNKHVALQIFPIYYKWKNITQQCKNNKLKIKIIAPT